MLLSQRTPLKQPLFLPMSRAEMEELGWDELDILLIGGDAYIDHPSFGVPLLGRFLVAHGYRVGIIAQPRWQGEDPTAVMSMGRPRLFAGVSAGAIDSMLAHYTAFRKKRHDDAYTPGGKAGARPNRAVIVYANLVRKAFPNLPVLGGGIEASLRRISHYDFWSDSLRRSLLFDARLDILSFGMGEAALLTLAQRLDAVHEVMGDDPEYLTADIYDSFQVWHDIAGTARLIHSQDIPNDAIRLPSHQAMLDAPAALLHASLVLEKACHQSTRRLVQTNTEEGGKAVLLEPPAAPLSTAVLDAIYALPFTRRAHPTYTAPIPAETMIANSITTHRGCGGGCSFCSLALHQGRRIASRSSESVLTEARRMTTLPHFNGSVSDVGGPSANMWQAACTAEPQKCNRTSCMFPKICKSFKAPQDECVRLLRQIQEMVGIKHVRVASGVRFDLALQDHAALEAYAGEFTGGQLKIAPEHCNGFVLQLMRKPHMAAFEKFLQHFTDYSRAHGKEQYVIPYLMSAFPGCTEQHMNELASWLRARHWSPQQVQCFIPTPGTVATAMFYAAQDPQGKPLYVARTDAQRRKQHSLLLGTVSK